MGESCWEGECEGCGIGLAGGTYCSSCELKFAGVEIRCKNCGRQFKILPHVYNSPYGYHSYCDRCYPPGSFSYFEWYNRERREGRVPSLERWREELGKFVAARTRAQGCMTIVILVLAVLLGILGLAGIILL